MTSWVISLFANALPSWTSATWRPRVDCLRTTTAKCSWSVNSPFHLVPARLVFALSILIGSKLPRIYVPMLSRLWLMHKCHALASCHLGAERTLRVFERVYYWVGMDSFTRWWLRHLLRCQDCKTARDIVRRPIFTFPSTKYFGPLPVAAKGHVCILCRRGYDQHPD